MRSDRFADRRRAKKEEKLRRKQYKKKRRILRRQRRMAKVKKFLKICLVFCIIITVCYVGLGRVFQGTITQDEVPSYVDQQLIVSDTSPRDRNILKVKDIVIHYVANPGSTAQSNRNYFARPDVHVNSHFVVGLNGEVIQCMPLYLRSAASNHRNKDTISIEVCHPDASGKFNEATYWSVVKLTAWLCDELNISRDRVIRHGDITGKNCPKYFMENEDQWLLFKEAVKNY